MLTANLQNVQYVLVYKEAWAGGKSLFLNGSSLYEKCDMFASTSSTAPGWMNSGYMYPTPKQFRARRDSQPRLIWRHLGKRKDVK